MEKFECCPKCKGKNGRAPEGYIMVGDMAYECDCHAKYVHDQQVKNLYKHYGFDMRHFDYNPRSYVGTESVEDKNRLLNYINQYVKNEDVRKLLVYLWGENGCQKSTLASYVGRRLISEGFSVRYVLMDKLVSLLQKEEFSEDAKYECEKYKESDLLIIDEAFDKSKMKLWKSGYQQSFIDSFIRDRIQSENKGIMFISNVRPENIESQGFSHSIQDFVEREVKLNKTLLSFKDNYISCSNIEFDSSKGLF